MLLEMFNSLLVSVPQSLPAPQHVPPPGPLDQLVTAMANNWFWTIIFCIVLCSLFFGCITKIAQTASRERTRREIAAYIAEGNMTVEQGERLLSSKLRDGA